MALAVIDAPGGFVGVEVSFIGRERNKGVVAIDAGVEQTNGRRIGRWREQLSGETVDPGGLLR